MKYLLILMVLFTLSFGDNIRFSPLPMDNSPKLFEQYSEMLKYLTKKTGYKFEFVYSSSYKDLLNKFENGKIDIIELGPLPFVRLKEDFKNAEPFLTFNSKDGMPYYDCVLVTKDKNIKTLADMNKNAKVGLTRKLSTCGYLMSELMFLKDNKSLEEFEYTYLNTHSNVLLNLLLTDNMVGTVKSTVLNKYKHFNFQVLDHSPAIPGFAFVANKKLVSNEKIEKIQDVLLQLDPLHNDKHKEIVSRWSSNTKYGAIKTKKDAYDVVYQAMKNIHIPKDN